MNRKEQLKEYVELCIRNEKAIAPYIALLGSELSIYDTLTETERYAAQLLDIKEKLVEIIEEFVICKFIIITDDNNITRAVYDIDEFIDLLLEWEENK